MSDSFEVFYERNERRLTVALTARYGPAVGRESALEALAWAWENWDRLDGMTNPAGYVYKVGRTRARRNLASLNRKLPLTPESDAGPERDQDLLRSLASLSRRQRQVAVLVHGYAYTHREVAELLGLSRSSVQRHAERALKNLRRAMDDMEEP